MKKTLLILTSLVFLAGCQASSHNTGNITNGGSSAGYSQDSGTSKELPKDRANATTNQVLYSTYIGAILVLGIGTIVWFIAQAIKTET